MKKGTAPQAADLVTVTVRLDSRLVDEAHALARRNKRAKPRIAEDAFYKVLNAALAAHLKKRGA